MYNVIDIRYKKLITNIIGEFYECISWSSGP